MDKSIFKMEFEKLWRMPVFYFMAAMFVAFNIWLFLYSKSNYLEAIEYDCQFMEKEPDSFQEVYFYDYYAENDMEAIKQMAKLHVDYGETVNKFISENYGKLQQRAENMSEDERNSLSFTGTYRLHQFLFEYYLKYLLIECAIIMVLSVIYLMHFEVLHDTEDLVFVSKTGQNIYKYKMAAAFLFSMLMSVGIMGISFGVYFGIVDYSGIWNSYVSSNFNTNRRTVNGTYSAVYPYITWIPATIKQYFIMCLAVVLGILIVCFITVGVLSKKVKNSITVIAIIVISVAGLYFIGDEIHFSGIIEFLIKFNPVHLITKCGYWFMDYAPGDTYPLYEILTLGTWLLGGFFLLILQCQKSDRLS